MKEMNQPYWDGKDYTIIGISKLDYFGSVYFIKLNSEEKYFYKKGHWAKDGNSLVEVKEKLRKELYEKIHFEFEKHLSKIKMLEGLRKKLDENGIEGIEKNEK